MCVFSNVYLQVALQSFKTKMEDLKDWTGAFAKPQHSGCGSADTARAQHGVFGIELEMRAY